MLIGTLVCVIMIYLLTCRMDIVFKIHISRKHMIRHSWQSRIFNSFSKNVLNKNTSVKN